MNTHSTHIELFDTHAHLDEETLQENLEEVLERSLREGVRTILSVGTSAASSAAAVTIAQQWPHVYAAVGIQPNYGVHATTEDWQQVVELAGHPRVRAIGETGLDRHWDFTPWDIQCELFDRHLQLALQYDLPFIVHMRDCSAETVALLRAARDRAPLRGVMHSFTGDLETARACLELGLYISFAGMVTFRKATDLRAIAAEIPADRILLETDSPYLSPHPLRGKTPNEPARITHTAQCLADVRGVSLAVFAEQTTANARKLFRCP